MHTHSKLMRLALLPAVLAFAACEAATAPGGEDTALPELQSHAAPVTNSNLLPIIAGALNWVFDADGNEVDPADADELLWHEDPLVADDPLKPLLAPDGHHVTMGEYTAVEGRARVKCLKKGTHLNVHLSGLLPRGVYTLWLALWDPPIDPTASLEELLPDIKGLGAAGPSDGSQNAFRASASGQGQVTLIIPPGPLSVFGEVGDPCLFDDPDVAQWHIVGAYHTDDMTHGPMPGPRVEPFLFIFDNP